MNLPGEKRRLSWDRGKTEIWALSGAVHHLEFDLPDGRKIRPLAEAPWHDDPETTGDASIPAHLRFLGGEWPCVPFGRTAADPVVHGHGTDHCWRFRTPTPNPSPQGGGAQGRRHVISATATPLEPAVSSPSPLWGGVGGGGQKSIAGGDTLSLSVDYPAAHPIARLARTVSAIPGEARLDFTLTAEARAGCVLPIGLHPILALGHRDEDVRVEGAFTNGETFPVVFEPGVSRLAPAARFTTPEALPCADGGTIAFGRLLNETTEEAFQLFGVDGTLRVVYPHSGYAVRLAWNPADFPTVLFWISTGGRPQRPWQGRFRGFGVEPLDARFEERDGQGAIAGGKRFLAGETWTTHYSLAVEPL